MKTAEIPCTLFFYLITSYNKVSQFSTKCHECGQFSKCRLRAKLVLNNHHRVLNIWEGMSGEYSQASDNSLQRSLCDDSITGCWVKCARSSELGKASLHHVQWLSNLSLDTWVILCDIVEKGTTINSEAYNWYSTETQELNAESLTWKEGGR